VRDRLRIARKLRKFDGNWAAVKYVFGRYSLAWWEIELMLSPNQTPYRKE
jgi:hypothetical protein